MLHQNPHSAVTRSHHLRPNSSQGSQLIGCPGPSERHATFTAVLAFSALLTIISVLYQPTRGPGDPQKLGWQSEATVYSKPATYGKVAIDNTTTQGDQTGSDNLPPETDWWDVETPESEIESPTLPLDACDPVVPHDTDCKCNDLYRSRFLSRLIPDSDWNWNREVLHRPWIRSWDV